MTLWEIQDDIAEGVALTSLAKRSGGQELWIDYLAGKNFLGRAAEIHAAFLEVASRLGCRYISGVAIRPGLSRLYQRVLAVAPRAQLFTEDLSNG